MTAVDLTSKIGSIELPNPVMTASGCAGHADELGHYFPLSELGAVVVKSIAAFEWPGNPAPRLHPVTGGMLNSVGLQGPGVAKWLRDDLPRLERAGARVVASIWARTVDDYGSAAKMLVNAPKCVVAVEVNLSCPNLDGGTHLFAHSPEATAEALRAAAICERPLWAKLSPNTDRLVEVARAAKASGADAVTLVNTVMGMVIDAETRRPALGAGGGGLSGRAIHPVAVRAVHDVRAAVPDLPIVGVGGVANAVDAVELMMAGASAVQVGTATFADPKAPRSVLQGLRDWCERHEIGAVTNIVGAVHEDR
jgi:dihydroorotate dehydrogenase (NAD+) catalytic subunit